MEENTWIEKFYGETDRDERKAILDAGIAEEGMTPENEIRMLLWKIRYEQRPKETREVDHFIRGWMNMTSLQRTAGSFWNKKKLPQEKEAVLADLAYPEMKDQGETGQKLYFRELKNMVRLYIELCRDDKTYNSVLLGIGRMKETSLLEKIACNVYEVAYQIPEEVNLTEELALLKKAATEAYYELYPKAKQRKYLDNLIGGAG